MTARKGIAVAWGALVALAALSTGRRADAHLGHPIVRAERALSLTLGDPPTLTYVVQLAPGESLRARKAADTDADGTVSATEGHALVDAWTAAVSREVTVAMGRGKTGEPRPLSALRLVSTQVTGLVTAAPPEGRLDDPQPVRVSWSWDLPALDDADRLRLDDAFALRPSSSPLDSPFDSPFDSTEVRVRDTKERPLIGLGDDPNVLSRSPQLAWVDAAHPGPRVVWVLFQPRPARAFPWWSVAAVLALLLGLWWFRRGRTVPTARDGTNPGT